MSTYREEEVTFTDAEWKMMLSDPAFGYVCQSGRHRIDGGTRNWSPAEGCMICFGENEYGMDIEAEEVANGGLAVEDDIAAKYALDNAPF